MAGIIKKFGGKKYEFHRWYPTKWSAQMEAGRLRLTGNLVRVVAGSSSYKPYHGKQGWRVYKRIW